MFDSYVLCKSKWKIDVIMPLMRKLKSDNMKNCLSMNTEADVSVCPNSQVNTLLYIYIYIFQTVIASNLYFRGNACSFLKELTLWFYEGFGIWNAVKENAKCHLSWIHSLPYCSSDKQRSHNYSQMIKGDPLCRKSPRWRIKSLLGSVSYTVGLWVKKYPRCFSAEGDLWSKFWESYCSVWRDKVSLCPQVYVAAHFSHAYRNIFMVPGLL